MKNKNILADVNLSKIDFSDFGTRVKLIFLDMDRGLPVAEIECSKLLAFSFTTTLSITDDDFAVYVGEVNVTKLNYGADILLEKKGFKISGGHSQFWEKQSHVFELSLEGGEIVLTATCGEILLNGTLLKNA